MTLFIPNLGTPPPNTISTGVLGGVLALAERTFQSCAALRGLFGIAEKVVPEADHLLEEGMEFIRDAPLSQKGRETAMVVLWVVLVVLVTVVVGVGYMRARRESASGGSLGGAPPGGLHETGNGSAGVTENSMKETGEEAVVPTSGGSADPTSTLSIDAERTDKNGAEVGLTPSIGDGTPHGVSECSSPATENGIQHRVSMPSLILGDRDSAFKFICVTAALVVPSALTEDTFAAQASEKKEQSSDDSTTTSSRLQDVFRKKSAGLEAFDNAEIDPIVSNMCDSGLSG